MSSIDNTHESADLRSPPEAASNILCTESLLALYAKYRSEIVELRDSVRTLPLVRRRMARNLLPGKRLRAQFDDVEAEILYMLVREKAPTSVVEISPCDGWTTTWLLKALGANQNGGTLRSFDLHNRSERFVPQHLRANWTLHLGDVRKNQDLLTSTIDFVLIDSLHTRGFADWYIRRLYPVVEPGSIFVIHDIYSSAIGLPSSEARLVRSWLANSALQHYTAGRAHEDGRRHSNELAMARLALDLDRPLIGERNPAVYIQC